MTSQGALAILWLCLAQLMLVQCLRPLESNAQMIIKEKVVTMKPPRLIEDEIVLPRGHGYSFGGTPRPCLPRSISFRKRRRCPNDEADIDLGTPRPRNLVKNRIYWRSV